MTAGRPWTRAELIDVLRLYCVTPFGSLHARNPNVIDIANRLDRTANSVAYKLVNFASLDPTIDRRGMSNTSALDRSVWSDFFANIDDFLDQPNENDGNPKGFAEDGQAQYRWDERQGVDARGTSKRRVNQGFFRSMIVASYDSRCAMTELSDPSLLVASHIDPWAQNTLQRLDPHNGICLNYLHDRAFEEGLIAIAPDLSILYSSRLTAIDLRKLRSVSSERLRLPARFKPDTLLLEKHRLTRFHM